MSYASFVCICLFAMVLIPMIDGRSITTLKNGVNGGVDCAVCSVVLGLIDKLAIVHNKSIEHALELLCDLLPPPYKSFCTVAVEYLGKIIIDGFIKGDNPDIICHDLKLCEDTPGEPKCRIYPSNKTDFEPDRALNFRLRYPQLGDQLSKGKICQFPGIKDICQIIDNIFERHLPEIDRDHDKFGTEVTYRGGSWRGRDCDDGAAKIHPGALTVQGDVTLDHNCNGIVGLNPATGYPYEDEFCNGTKRMGIAVLGDSTSAHFHMPEQWLDARDFSEAAFEHLAFILEDELDWPEMSASTGHINVSWPNIDGPTRSIYLRLFDLDHCNHRDYQNIAVNGARSGSMLDIMKSLARDPQNDVPLLVFYSLVGTDVCNRYPDTVANMTTVEEMHANVLQTLTYLDTILPNGSHVLATGLANGSYLYDLLQDHMHPFGRVGTPLTYPQMYDYLSCLQISPCNGWLTSNSTLRDLTTQRAVDLSGAIKDTVLSYQAHNFDTAYVDFPLDQVVAEWVAQGGEPWQLIESADGYHINQFGHAIVSDVLWGWLQTEKPQWLPPLNPHNADIERVFKDQGGY